jgi:hypothetical protein
VAPSHARRSWPRLSRALALSLPFVAAACGDSSPTGASRDLDADALSAASTSVDATLEVPVLQFLSLSGVGSPSVVASMARLRPDAAPVLLRTRAGGPVVGQQERVASGVRLQIARAVSAGRAAMFDESMYGMTFIATPDGVYRDEARTGAPANGFAIVLNDEGSNSVGTIEVRDSSTTSVDRQAITIRTADGVTVAQYSESLSGAFSETGPSSLHAESHGTIGDDRKTTFTRSFSLDQDAEGLGTIVYSSQYTLPGGAHTGVELRLVEPAEGASTSLSLTYGRGTFRIEVPSVRDETQTSGWAASDTARVIINGRLAALILPGDVDGDGDVVAPDGGPIPARDLLVFSRAQELATKLMQVDSVVGAVQEFVNDVVSYVAMTA